MSRVKILPPVGGREEDKVGVRVAGLLLMFSGMVMPCLLLNSYGACDA